MNAKCSVTSSLKCKSVIIRLNVSFHYLRIQKLKHALSVKVEGHFSVHTWLNSRSKLISIFFARLYSQILHTFQNRDQESVFQKIKPNVP